MTDLRTTPARVGRAKTKPLRVCISAAMAVFATGSLAASPRTPIEHVIVIVGENRTFDNLFATYQPKSGASVRNLLSLGIVTTDGSPGPNFRLAEQHTGEVLDLYTPTPKVTGSYSTLPQPYAAGAFGQRRDVPDARFAGSLPNGPFQITHHVSYGAHTGDPIHRFFQMWQQINGGKNDLFVWTAETVGMGPSNGDLPLGPGRTYQGGVAMGFYNMARGDAAYFRALADEYAIADNFHQSIQGGTTANYFALATADVGYYTADGAPAKPPAKLIENPNPQPGTNNWYIEDGYQGGSLVACADRVAPGVAPIQAYLASLPYRAFRDGNCEPGHYYMVNNLEPAYLPDGGLREDKPEKPVLPPQTIPNIGDVLSAGGVSWKWYSGGRNDGKTVDREYCAMCDTLSYFTSTMTGPDRARLQDLQQFYIDVKNVTTFPSVAVIAPYDSISGHPGYAAEPGFDELVRDVITRVQANPALWQRTVILVTFDEGGGYYDSGYVQPIDFFGDGTRIPMIAVSPYARAGHVDHTYYDHASINKFIAYNWGLPPTSARSRDNLPNPIHHDRDPYVPVNRPAIGDLTGLFDFSREPQP
jgi:phospholipase C